MPKKQIPNKGKKIDLYIKWLEKNHPDYEITEVGEKGKYIQVMYKVKALWTQKYYVIINFNEN